MATILQLSEARAGLPEFAGTTLIEKLVNGRAEARARLLKYTDTIRFKRGSADDLVAEIQTWQEINASVIQARMANPETDTLPEQIALEFGPKKAQDFVIAGYSYAVEGMGPWVTGELALKMATDPRFPQPWVEDDAKARLDVFAAIVKLDDDGDLERIFKPEKFAAPQQASGFGFLPAVVAAVGPTWTVVALVLVVLGTVGLFLVFTHSLIKTRLNNKALVDLCKENPQIAETCAEYFAEGQEDALSGALTRVATIAAVGAVLYGAVVFGGPALSQAMRRSRRAT